MCEIILIFPSDISHRCHLAWQSLPAHLRYTPQCWANNYAVAVSLLLIVSYLAYLYNDFLIQRLLAGKQNPIGSAALLSVSAEILSSVLTIGSQREQMVDLRPDFTWTVSLHSSRHSLYSLQTNNGTFRSYFTAFQVPASSLKPSNTRNAPVNPSSTKDLDQLYFAI